MVNGRTEEILELIDSVVTAYVLNERPEEALDNIAFYYQVDRNMVEELLMDVYYNFILEKTDFRGQSAAANNEKAETLLRVLIYLIILKDASINSLLSSLNLSKEELKSIYEVVSKNPRLIERVIEYIYCADRVLVGVRN